MVQLSSNATQRIISMVTTMIADRKGGNKKNAMKRKGLERIWLGNWSNLNNKCSTQNEETARENGIQEKNSIKGKISWSNWMWCAKLFEYFSHYLAQMANECAIFFLRCAFMSIGFKMVYFNMITALEKAEWIKIVPKLTAKIARWAKNLIEFTPFHSAQIFD